MSGVRLVINLHTVPGGVDEYCAAWLVERAAVLAEDGCQQYELFRSAANPDHIAVLELWRDRAAFDAHWELELTRPPVRPELIARRETRLVGSDSVEIYWEQVEQRYSMSAGAWVAR